MGASLLVEYYNELPEPREGSDIQEQLPRVRAALETFKKQVSERYTEGTLHRLLESNHVQDRRAAVLALGMVGTMQSNRAVAERLHDEDHVVRQLASDALWTLWFRADATAHVRELQRLMRVRNRDKALAGLDDLIRKAPQFAEAFNQRAILYFRKKDYPRSVADCEKVIQLNPCHFAALAGMGQSFLHLNKPRAALKAFRRALEINPEMGEVEETIRTLESALGEEGKK